MRSAFAARHPFVVANGALAVYQPVNSVELFARSGRNVVPVSILGRITTDPWVYSFKTILAITPDYVTRLEQALDTYNEGLPALKDFILPGGGPGAAACHLARTVCRRAERRVSPTSSTT